MEECLITTLEECFSHLVLLLTFYPCFRQVTCESSKGVTMTTILSIAMKSIILVCWFSLVVVLGRSQVITLKEAIVKVAKGNKLDET
jgi:hypothetical protein